MFLTVTHRCFMLRERAQALKAQLVSSGTSTIMDCQRFSFPARRIHIVTLATSTYVA